MGLFDDVLKPQTGLFDDVLKKNTQNIDLDAPVGSEGFVGGVVDLGRGLARGAISSLPKQLGEAADFFADRKTGVGTVLQDFAKQTEEATPYLKQSIIGQREQQDPFSIRGGAYAAGENLPLSLAPPVIGAIGGGMVGGVPGAAVGAAAGALGALPVFYGSQGHETQKKVEEAQLKAGASPEEAHRLGREAGHLSGAIESGGELLGDLIPLGALAKPFTALAKPVGGAAVRSLFGGQLKKALGTVAKTEAGEVLTEMGQQAGEAEVEGRYGAGEGATWKDTASVIMPTAIMSLFPGGLAAAHNFRHTSQIKRALETGDADPERRAAAASAVFTQLKDANPATADAFSLYARDQIASGQPIEISDDDFYAKWVTEKNAPPAMALPAPGQVAMPMGEGNVGPIQTVLDANAQAAQDHANAVYAARDAVDAQRAAPGIVAGMAQGPDLLGHADFQAPPPGGIPPSGVTPEEAQAHADAVYQARAIEEARQAALPSRQAGLNPAAGPISAMAANAMDSGLTGMQTAQRAGPIAQIEAETQQANEQAAAKEAAKAAPTAAAPPAAPPTTPAPSVQVNKGTSEPTGGYRPATRAPLFPFPTPVAAQKRAAALTQSTGEQHVAVPHPLKHDSYTVVPASGEAETMAQQAGGPIQRAEPAQAAPDTAAAQPAAAPTPERAALAANNDLQQQYLEALTAGNETRADEIAAQIDAANSPKSRQISAKFPPEIRRNSAESAEIPPNATDAAAHEAASSPTNDKVETTAQILAGNQEKGRHIKIGPFDISVENPEGSTRTDKANNPPKWSRTIAQAHYGYIKGTIGADKDHIDAFVKPGAESNHYGPVYVIDQHNEAGKFDEHKALIGYASKEEAAAAYHANYPPDWKGMKAITETTTEEFNLWARSGDTKRPFSETKAPPAETAGPVAETPVPERRKDLTRRQRVAEMSPEEMRRELLTSELTGLGNRRAYDESEKLPVQIMADADSLKWINDNMGHESGDAMLRAIGAAIAAEAPNGYHLSGDEFAVQAKTQLEADAVMARVKDRLSQADITVALPDGGSRSIKGIGLSYGKGTTLAEADGALAQDKAAREKSGERASRGSSPPGATEVAAQRVEDHVGNAPAKEEVAAESGAPAAPVVEETKPAEVKAEDVANVSADDFDALINEVLAERAEKPSGLAKMQAAKKANEAARGPKKAKRKIYPQWAHELGLVDFQAVMTTKPFDSVREGGPYLIEIAPDSMRITDRESGKYTYIPKWQVQQAFKDGTIVKVLPTGKAGDFIKQAGQHAAEGVKAGFAGLDALFGRKGTLGSGPSFDEETWAKAKPHFEAAFNEFVAAGKSLKEFVRHILDAYNETVIPYLKRWHAEKTQGANDGTRTDAVASKEDDSHRDADQRPDDVRGSVGEREVGGGTEQPSQDVLGDDGAGGRRRDAQSSVDGSGTGVRDEGRVDRAGEAGGDRIGAGDGAGVPAGAGTAVADYRPAPGDLDRVGSWREAAKRNLDILELIHKLDAEKRQATPDEQALLAKFTGWGSSELRQKLFITRQDRETKRPVLDPESYRVDPAWKPLIERAAEIMTPEELDTALASTQYAHYTSEPIVRSIWSALQRLGFKAGKILEPGMGTGVFHQLAPDSVVKDSRYTGIERESLTAAIARHLLPKQIVMMADYVKQKLPNGYFDIAIGNPPFAKTPILDDPAYKRYRFSLHDYFFAKTIDKVRPGGVMVFVTSRYTMDKVGDRARKYLAERADLIGAVRLPQTAFKANAGTEVVTDVLFLRKRAKDDIPGGKSWLELKEIDAGGKKALVNEYFADHPEMVLGAHSTKGTMYVHNSYTVLPSEGNIDELFQKAIENLPKDVYTEASATAGAERKTFERDLNPKVQKDGSLYVGEDGMLYRREQGAGRRLEEVKSLPPHKVAWLKGFVKLRDIMKQARYDQRTDGDWEASLKKLNLAYTAFVKEHGPILAYSEREKTDTDADGNLFKRIYRVYKNSTLLQLDVEGPLVAALENINSSGDIVKSHLLTGRVLGRDVAPTINTTTDALLVSLSDLGRLDLQRIADMRNITVKEVIDELGDAIYQDPTHGWQTRDEYLSGNVVKKLEEARVAAASDESFRRNVDALYKAQPAPLTANDVTINIGSPWIDPVDIAAFANEVMDIETEPVYKDVLGYWEVPGSSSRSARKTTSEWGTAKRSPFEILEAAINNRSITIKPDQEKKGDAEAVAKAEADTTAANEKVSKLKERFRQWVWTDTERAGRMLVEYNARFNNIAPREFDGSFLRLPGLSLRWQNSLHPHQKRAIWRQIQTGNSYLAHAVGAGKTMEMIIGAMEQRRLGLIQKPIFVVPNHMLEQFSNEFLDAYPGADIMVAGDTNFDATNRRRFVAQAASNNPDAIIITHSAFELIGPPPAATARVLQNLVDDLRAAMDDLDESDRRTRSQIEARIEQLERRFGGRTNTEGTDNVVTLDEMGVDHMYVDEAHEFRKLDFVTNMNKIKGITPEGSRRALDLYIKVQALEEINPGRSHTFASGTPVTNTLGELYSIMRFMDEAALDEMGVRAFDSWASQFGEVASFDERNAAGTYEVVERFAVFVNVADLMSRVRRFMDVLTTPQLSGLVKRPAVAGGEPSIVLSESSDQLRKYMKELDKRIEQSRKWRPSPEEKGNPDPLINIITDGRLASIDIRFVMRGVTLDPSSKLNKMLDEIIATDKRHRDATFTDPATGKVDPIRGVGQIVFSAIGFGEAVAANRGFDVRKYVTSRLREGGIRAEQIAWMSDYKSPTQKEAMFRQMREGKIKVLIGSPKNMGTGLNVQRRLKALHYLAPPWYPADIEQPHGRILRQGNLNQEVDLKWYATKGTYDATQWQMIARKARFIEQALTGDRSVRRLEDISEASQYEQASAMSSGDERVIKYARLLRDIESLENLQRAHAQEQIDFRSRRDTANYIIGDATKYKEKLVKAVAAGGGTYIPSSISTATIDGVTYEKFGEIGAALLGSMKRHLAAWNPTKDGESVRIGTIGDGKKSWPISVELGADKTSTWVRPAVTIGPVERLGTIFAEGREYSPQEQVSVGGELFSKVSAIDSELFSTERRIAEQVEERTALERRIGAPFERKQELLTKLAESVALRNELLAVAAPVDPHAEETPPAEETVSELVDAAKVDGSPDAAKFDLGSPGAGMARAEVQAVVGAISAKWRSGPKVNVVQSIADLPFQAPSQARGAFWNGAVYLVADNLKTAAAAQFVLLHEAAGHFGLSAILGDQLDPLMRMIYDSNAKVREMADQRIAHAARLGKVYSPALATEEALADLAATGEVAGIRGWKLLVAKIRAALRQLGFTLEVSDDDIGALLKRAREALEGHSAPVAGKAKFSTNGRQIDAPEFKRWFGDSKVVDDNGEPLVVYHGTGEDFSLFDRTAEPRTWEKDRGLQFFTDSRSGASGYAENEGSGANVMPVYLSIKNPRVITVEGDPSAWWDAQPPVTWKLDVESLGHDGMIVRGDGSTLFITSDPAQIKSATGNRGTFDPNNPDIRYSLLGQGVDAVTATLNNPRKFNWWHRTIGTQFHKAQAVPEFRPVFESAQRYLQDVSQLAIDAADQAPGWLPRLAKFADVFKFGPPSKDLAAVSKVVFEGTLNATRPDAVALRNLTHAQRKLYTQARAAIDLSLDQVAVSELYKLAGDEGIDDAQRAAKGMSPGAALDLLQTALTMQAEDLMAVGKADEAGRKGKLIDQMEAVVKKLEKLKSEGYAPLMRFGQYTVDVTHVEMSQSGKPVVVRDFFGMYESNREAQKAERAMRAEFPDSTVTTGTIDDEGFKLYRGLSLDSLALFAEATGMKENHLFQDYYKLAVSARSALTRLIHRKGIAGYNEDLQRVLASFITSNARMASRHFHFGEMTQAAVRIPTRMGDVRAEAAKLVDYVQNPTEEASGLRGLLFVNFLGGSVASALTNATQPVLMTLPYLSQFKGSAAAGKALLAASKVATGGVSADPALRAAMITAGKEGITEPQELHQLYAESIRGLGSSMAVRRGLRVWGSMFSLAESFNRRITFAAAFQIAQGMTPAELRKAGVDSPFAFAEKAVEDTQGIYNRGNRPNWARGTIGATVFTFKQYSIAYLEFLKRLPAKEKAIALSLLVLAAGLQGLPGADDLEDLIDTIGQMLGYNTNSKQAIREAAIDTLGKELGGLLMHGASGLPGSPVDVQQRLGLSNLIPGTGMFLRSSPDKAREIAEVVGPIGGVYTQATSAAGSALAGQWGQVVAAATPVAVQNVIKGWDMAESGVYKDTRGRKVVDVTATDAAFKALGVQPKTVGDAQRVASDVQQSISMARIVEADIADKWARSIIAKDQAGVQKAVAELLAWNQNNPDWKIKITPAQIKARVQAALLSRDVRLLKSAPAEVRQSVFTTLSGN